MSRAEKLACNHRNDYLIQPSPSASAWTYNAGRGLAVRRFELGKRAKTTLPRLTVRLAVGGIVVVVNRHFRAVPIRRKGGQMCPGVRSLSFADA